MIQPAEVKRDECGYWTHPEWDRFCDGREGIPKAEVEEWLSRHGLELALVELEGLGEDSPLFRAYFEESSGDMSAWELSPPAGEGWFPLSIHYTEDGPMQVWARQAEVWSTDGELFRYDSLAELLKECDHIREGSTLYRGSRQPLTASMFVDADQVIDNMADGAGDVAGEAADTYPDVSAEARQELQAFLEQWAEKHCPPKFYLVEGVEEHVVTAEELARFQPVQEGAPS